MQYRPEIDSLRALAVVPVILFHGQIPHFEGGYVGVDVFFVISGYLITSIIHREIEEDRFSIVRFYERRARRILPALLFICAIITPLAVVLLMPDQLRNYFQSLFSVALFSSNFLFWWESGYFGQAAEVKPLLHTWSLSVEEQFYIVFPILLILLHRLRVRRVALTILVLSAISLAISEIGVRTMPSGAFYILPTRAWELGAGAVIALGALPVARVGRAWCETGSLAGLAMILVAIFTFDNSTPFPGLAALLPALGAGLIIAFARPPTAVARVLSWRPLVAVGLVSYSAYLWHQPLFVFGRIYFWGTLTPGLFLALSALSLALAYLTWRFVERPFRARGVVSTPSVFNFAAVATAVALAVGVFGATSVGHIYQLIRTPQQITVLKMIDEARADHDKMGREAGTKCRFWTRHLTDATERRILDCVSRHGGAVLILGDSHAIDLYNAVIDASDVPAVVGLSDGGCRPQKGMEPCYYNRLLMFVSAHPDAVRSVIYNQAGFYLLRDIDGTTGSREMFGRRMTHPFEPSLEDIRAARDYLLALAAHVPVTWFGPWVEPHVDRLAFVTHSCAARPQLDERTLATFRTLDKTIAATVPKEGPLKYVSLVDALAFDPAADIIDCEALYFSDGDHWSKAGEARFGKRLKERGLL